MDCRKVWGKQDRLVDMDYKANQDNWIVSLHRVYGGRAFLFFVLFGFVASCVYCNSLFGNSLVGNKMIWVSKEISLQQKVKFIL